MSPWRTTTNPLSSLLPLPCKPHVLKFEFDVAVGLGPGKMAGLHGQGSGLRGLGLLFRVCGKWRKLVSGVPGRSRALGRGWQKDFKLCVG